MIKAATIIRGLIITILLAGSVFAITPVYVDASTGNDLNDGSIGAPKLTIQAGVDAVDPGGIVYVAIGSYTGFTVNTANITVLGDSGTANIAGCGPSAPTINGGVFIRTTGVTIAGFNINNPVGYYGIMVGELGGTRPDGAKILHNRVFNVNGTASGDGIRAISVEPGDNIEVSRNLVEDILPTNSAVGSYGKTISGIFVRARGGALTNVKIEDNIIRDIYLMNGSPANQSANGIWIGSSAGTSPLNGLIIKRNHIYNIQSNLTARGILINHGTAVAGTISPEVSENNIHNITGVTFAFGFSFEQYSPGAIVRNNLFSSLTAVPSTNIAAINFENNSNPSTFTIQYNSFNVQWGIRNATAFPVIAEGNWWGDTDPSNNIWETPGDIDYSPWWGEDHNADPSHPWVWIVTPGDNIQNVINGASEDDIIIVESGSYGPITLNKNGLVITGNPARTFSSVRNDRNRMSPSAFPGPTFERINVAADDVSIFYIHINNPAGGAGIYNSVPIDNLTMDYIETITQDEGASFNEVTGLSISNAEFKNSVNSTGIKILSTTNIYLENVSANGNQLDGIHLDMVNNVSGLNITGNNNDRYGLNIGEASVIEIENGVFTFNLDGLHIHPHWDSDVNTTDVITGFDLSGIWNISNNTNRGIVLQSDGNGISGATNSTSIINPIFNGTFTLSGNGAGGINIFGIVSNPYFSGFTLNGSSYGMLITGLSGMAYQPVGVTINNSSFNNFGSSWPNFAISLSDYVSKYSTNDVDAKYNLWNGSPVPNVESIVWHKNDDPALGLVITGQVLLSYPANGSLGHPLKPRLEWLAHVPAVSYTIQIANNSNFTAPTEYTVTAPQLTYDILVNLLNDTRYYWRVRAKETNVPLVYSAWSNPWNFKTTATGLSGVQIPQLFNPIDGFNVYTLTPTLSWGTYQAGITSYQLQYTAGDLSALMVSTPIVVPATGGNTLYTLPTLVAGEDYLWRVRSYNSSSGIYSGWSDPEIFSVDASQGPTVPYPSYPVNTTVYTNYPTFYWYTLSAATGILFDVEVQRLTPSAVTIPLLNNTNLTGLFYLLDVNELADDDSLLKAGNYQWRVTAHKPGYSFTSAWTPFTISGIAINIPVKPIISWPRDGALQYTTTPVLNWYTGSTNINNIVFDWEISTSNAVNGSGAFTSTVDFGTNSYAPVASGVGPLNDGTLYYWHVRGRNTVSSITSDWSDTESFITSGTGGGVPASPSLIYPTGGIILYTLTPTLSWSVPLNSGAIANYRVEISSENNPDFVTFRFVDTGAPVTNSFAVPPGTLINGVTYYWRVSASYVGPAGPWGAPTAIGSFTTMAGSAPVVPMTANPVYGSVFRTESPALSWYLPTKGESLSYELQYSTNKQFTDAVTIEGLDKPNFDLSNLPSGQYYWRVRSKNSNGEYSYYSGRNEFRIGDAVTAVETKENIIPETFEVNQNYPNPFNPSTTISFGVPEASKVSVRIYDMLGREIKMLLNEEVQAGTHQLVWNGDNNYGQKVSSGTYIYRVVSGSNVKSMKMILLK